MAATKSKSRVLITTDDFIRLMQELMKERCAHTDTKIENSRLREQIYRLGNETGQIRAEIERLKGQGK